MSDTEPEGTNLDAFDPRNHLIKLKGQPYLEVRWRLVWLRKLHPDASIETKFIELTDEVATFAATVTIPGGGSATGHSRELRSNFADYTEKAETAAIGRALAALGFGVQFCGDFGTAEHDEQKMTRNQRHAPQRSPMRAMSDYDEPPDHVPERQGMTERQMSFIRQMARDRDISDEAMDKRVQELFGKTFGQLDRADASSLIERLKESAPVGSR